MYSSTTKQVAILETPGLSCRIHEPVYCSYCSYTDYKYRLLIAENTSTLRICSSLEYLFLKPVPQKLGFVVDSVGLSFSNYRIASLFKYYLNIISEFDKLWVITSDVHIPSPGTLESLDHLYPDQDLLVSGKLIKSCLKAFRVSKKFMGSVLESKYLEDGIRNNFLYNHAYENKLSYKFPKQFKYITYDVFKEPSLSSIVDENLYIDHSSKLGDRFDSEQFHSYATY